MRVTRRPRIGLLTAIASVIVVALTVGSCGPAARRRQT